MKYTELHRLIKKKGLENAIKRDMILK